MSAQHWFGPTAQAIKRQVCELFKEDDVQPDEVILRPDGMVVIDRRGLKPWAKPGVAGYWSLTEAEPGPEPGRGPARQPVPAGWGTSGPWARLAADTAGFEPGDDGELLEWMAAESAGMAGYGEALSRGVRDRHRRGRASTRPRWPRCMTARRTPRRPRRRWRRPGRSSPRTTRNRGSSPRPAACCPMTAGGSTARATRPGGAAGALPRPRRPRRKDQEDQMTTTDRPCAFPPHPDRAGHEPQEPAARPHRRGPGSGGGWRTPRPSGPRCPRSPRSGPPRRSCTPPACPACARAPPPPWPRWRPAGSATAAPADPEHPRLRGAELAAVTGAAGGWVTAATVWGPLAGPDDLMSVAYLAGTRGRVLVAAPPRGRPGRPGPP